MESMTQYHIDATRNGIAEGCLSYDRGLFTTVVLLGSPHERAAMRTRDRRAAAAAALALVGAFAVPGILAAEETVRTLDIVAIAILGALVLLAVGLAVMNALARVAVIDRRAPEIGTVGHRWQFSVDSASGEYVASLRRVHRVGRIRTRIGDYAEKEFSDESEMDAYARGVSSLIAPDAPADQEKAVAVAERFSARYTLHSEDPIRLESPAPTLAGAGSDSRRLDTSVEV